MSSTRRLVASNTAVQVAGKAVTLAIGLASIAIITRYLGPEDYGKYTLALTYMQLFAVLADVGLFTIVVREISRDPSRPSGSWVTRSRFVSYSPRARLRWRRCSASCCLTTPTCGWRSCSPGCRSFRDAEQHVPHRAPGAPAHGPRGGRRRDRSRAGAGGRGPRRGPRPGFLRRDGHGGRGCPRHRARDDAAHAPPRPPELLAASPRCGAA